MRICVIGLRGLPGVMGGVEKHCEELLPRVLRGARPAEILVLTRACYAPVRGEFRGVRLIPLWAWRNKYAEALLHTVFAVFYARFKLRPEILHIHAIGPALMTPLARVLGLRVVVTHHGEDYRREKWGLAARIALRMGEWCAVMCAARVIAVSPATAADLRARFPARAERIAFIPNGIPSLGRAVTDLPERLGVAGRPFLLSVGRLVPEKGFADLLAAQQRLVAAGEAVGPLVIAGEADHADGFASRLRASAGPGVVFAGRVPGEELAQLYRSCTLFVLASHHEGLPIAALEALGAGAPVLLSDIAANRALELPAHCYFRVGDQAHLAAKLREPAARFRVALPDPARFDWDVIARQTAEVYRQSCGRRGAQKGSRAAGAPA